MRSIETQKKLMYIPLLNIANVFIVFLNLRQSKGSGASLVKIFVYVLGYLIPVWFVFSAAAKVWPDLYPVFSTCLMYCGPLALSWGSIKFQEKYM
ncbi:MAG: hypothetical protein IKC09_10715 [Oscillospiraceae bacterium]|nr:hypothetical protein [Oscillospiraceae bacterium]